MSEISFAKGFLATLDKKPIKLAADHVSDPRKYPNQSPFILPRQTHPFPRHGLSSSAPVKTKTITATLKPMKAGETITVTDVTLDSSVHDVKSQYAQKSGQPLEKVKLLLNKKPAADMKTLKDLGIDGDVEFAVMIMGGGTTPVATPAVETRDPMPSTSAPAAPAAPADEMNVDAPAPKSEKTQARAAATPSTGDSAAEILKSEEFWTDLKGFLAQRLRNDGEAENLSTTFRDAWKAR